MGDLYLENFREKIKNVHKRPPVDENKLFVLVVHKRPPVDGMKDGRYQISYPTVWQVLYGSTTI